MKNIWLFATLFLAMCLPLSVEAEGESGMFVEVQEVSRHALQDNIQVMGLVDALQNIKVSSQYGGRIIHLKTRLGAYVKHNEVIANIRKKEAEALLSSGNFSIKDINILAPLSGYIIETFSFPGEIVAAGQPLLRIISPEGIYITMNIPGEYLSKVKKGTPLTVKEKGEDYRTSIDAVVPVTDPATGTFLATARIRTQHLYPGIVCKVVLCVAEKTALAVPRAAILTQEGGQIVFVISGNRAERRVVETGIRTDTLIEIKKGIMVGEKVVVVGNYELSDGMVVRVKKQ